MSYGSARMRAYYGAGDYSAGLALRQAYTGAYYPAGGFWSSLKNIGSKVVSTVGKVVSNPWVGAGLSLIPGGGLVGKGIGIASSLVSKAAPVLKAGAKIAAAAGAGAIGAGIANKLAFGQSPSVTLERMDSPRRRSSSSSRSRTTRKRATRRRSRGRARGDWGDAGGRDKRGHFLNERGGHAHFKRSRRRRRRSGQRVSFTTKSGRRVSFTAR